MCSYHLQDGGVAPDDEGQTSEALDAMSDSHRKLLVKVLGTALHTHTHTRKAAEKLAVRGESEKSKSSSHQVHLAVA